MEENFRGALISSDERTRKMWNCVKEMAESSGTLVGYETDNCSERMSTGGGCEGCQYEIGCVKSLALMGLFVDIITLRGSEEMKLVLIRSLSPIVKAICSGKDRKDIDSAVSLITEAMITNYSKDAREVVARDLESLFADEFDKELSRLSSMVCDASDADVEGMDAQ